jgi:plastocyanin
VIDRDGPASEVAEAACGAETMLRILRVSVGDDHQGERNKMTITNLISGRLLAVVAAGTLTLAACSSASTPAASSGAGASVASGCTPSATVTGTPTAAAIADNSFNPTAITVAKGGTVTWANGGSNTHTVTADAGSFDSCNLAGGATFTAKFDTAGTVAFHCKIHSSMQGTITVTG